MLFDKKPKHMASDSFPITAFGWPILVGILLAVVAWWVIPQWLSTQPQKNTHQMQSVLPAQAPLSFAPAVNLASPAVANLYTTKKLQRSVQAYPHLSMSDPLGSSLPNQARRDSSLGSAVIMTEEGFLLTNYHVIEGADQILVSLKDGREASAQLVGTDRETDLAILKIDLPDLPVIQIGRSDHIQTGDVVLAIGNPFGVGQTVTSGIIGATGRNHLGLNTYEDFIQTDAAINPGNSGGALINSNGSLIGINTAIFNREGGSQGIGFAIPINLAREIMQAILSQGRVIRGWIGVEIQALTPEIADKLQIQPQPGLVVAGIYRDGPAMVANLALGDIILKVDGHVAGSERKTMNRVARMQPGQTTHLEILRNNQILQKKVIIGIRPAPKS